MNKVLLTILTTLTFVGAACADSLNIETLPPVVIQTFPVSGDLKVDPAISEIRVVFSKAMKDKNWSWVQLDKQSYPKINGQPAFLNDRTCVLKVNLEPGKNYAIWLNTQIFRNFKDLNGVPAVPYLLTFRTLGKESAAVNGEAIKKAERWLKAIDKGRYPLSWEMAAAFFKKKVPKTTWIEQMKKHRSGLGKVLSRKLKIAKFLKELPGAPKGEYVVIQFETSFENKKNAIETVTPMKGEDTEWRVSGYYIK